MQIQVKLVINILFPHRAEYYLLAEGFLDSEGFLSVKLVW